MAFEAASEAPAIPAPDDVTANLEYDDVQRAKIELLDTIIVNVQALITVWRNGPDTNETIAYLTQRQGEWRDDREIPEVARSAREEEERVQEGQRQVEEDELNCKAARILRAELHSDVGWVAGPMLEKATFGKVAIRSRKGPFGRIIDRIAIKDNDSANTSQAGNLDIEVAAMYRLRHLKGSSSVDATRNFRPDWTTGVRFRIYVEYSPFDNLWFLICRYTSYDSKNSSDQPTAYIPEPFIC
ncbi:hypothetical protein DOTSEDRAFT_22084 [Dothistroma septosporum NZE10]|uniref:Uncharacterized protein n=1 Tax=Dothistroma septosporum (strain NZE10 / CBS 128990) TaxID=675120 RepID=N1PR89_DOTSN|nr:hypothetical protein DOTSEDRAFT_22084 [Dothistroma septosporum NZE10]